MAERLAAHISPHLAPPREAVKLAARFWRRSALTEANRCIGRRAPTRRHAPRQAAQKAQVSWFDLMCWEHFLFHATITWVTCSCCDTCVLQTLVCVFLVSLTEVTRIGLQFRSEAPTATYRKLTKTTHCHCTQKTSRATIVGRVPVGRVPQTHLESSRTFEGRAQAGMWPFLLGASFDALVTCTTSNKFIMGL